MEAARLKACKRRVFCLDDAIGNNGRRVVRRSISGSIGRASSEARELRQQRCGSAGGVLGGGAMYRVISSRLDRIDQNQVQRSGPWHWKTWRDGLARPSRAVVLEACTVLGLGDAHVGL